VSFKRFFFFYSRVKVIKFFPVLRTKWNTLEFHLLLFYFVNKYLSSTYHFSQFLLLSSSMILVDIYLLCNRILFNMQAITVSLLLGGINTISAELITSLPGLAVFPTWKQYAGYVNYTSPMLKSTHHTFHWITESQDDPTKDPLIFWTNGGKNLLDSFQTIHT
jgi:hypothetical protein